jgi:hypothetical protein
MLPWVALVALPFVACAAPSASSSFNSNNGSSSGSTAINITTGTDSFGDLDANMASMGDARPLRCDNDGNCSCIKIASIGHEGVWGPCSSDTTTAFQDWLNTQSTASVDTYDQTKPTLTKDFLAQYDVIVLQWMVANGTKNNDGAAWVFSSDEVSALQDWVNNGGGIVALNGYQGMDPTQVFDTTATNQLLSFSDIQFNKVVDVATTGNLAYCFGNCVPLGGPVGDSGLTSVGTWDQTTPIGAHVTSVGALDMRSISASTAVTDCTDGTNKYAVHEQIGKGHIVAYGDEWITYSGEWNGMGACLGDGGIYGDPYDPCFQKSPTEIFQIPQFWYNAIKYAASSVTCFNITSPGIVR